MTALNRNEFRLIESLVGAINMFSEKVPALTKAIENTTPTTNHQRQVAALKRQSEAVVYIDETIGYTNNHIKVEDYNRDELVLGFREIERRLKILRKDLTG